MRIDRDDDLLEVWCDGGSKLICWILAAIILAAGFCAGWGIHAYIVG